MKRILLTTLTVLGLFSLNGCSKPAGGNPDTTRVESAFATVSAVEKGEVERGLAALRTGDYLSADTLLNQAANNVRLTPAQQAALKDLIAQVRVKLTEAPGQTGQTARAADKAVGDPNRAGDK